MSLGMMEEVGLAEHQMGFLPELIGGVLGIGSTVGSILGANKRAKDEKKAAQIAAKAEEKRMAFEAEQTRIEAERQDRNLKLIIGAGAVGLGVIALIMISKRK